MKRYLSGITPSSSKGLHIGNYFGAVKPHVEFQSNGECYYFIADYHALNTVFDAGEFNNNIYETYLDYLALGIEAEKTVFYVESHIPQIFELSSILRNVVNLGQMMRMHAYKDKLANPDADQGNINMGLFTYPILMAADILLFQPDAVPVGVDQSQHVEVARDIAQSFNYRYGDVFKIPELYIEKEVAKILGTDGTRKMGKSIGNDITIFADEEIIKKQINSIVTDPNRVYKTDPGDPDKNITFSYLRLIEFPESQVVEMEERYRAGTIGDSEIKDAFFESFISYFSSQRELRVELAKDENYIKKTMKTNADKANLVANKTMEKVRKAIGAIDINKI